MPEKIPNDRIVCPATFWRHVMNEQDRDCKQVYCCYHCPKFRKCPSSGCSKDAECLRERGYPKKCRVYPVTYEELKNLFFWALVLDRESLEDFRLVDLVVINYLKEKKI